MTKARKHSIATNHRAIEFVEVLAISHSQTLGPVRADSSLADFPSHVMLGGVPTRVVACSPKERADGRRVHVFNIRPFRDIVWQVLVCMPGDPADEPIIYRLPRTVWTQHARIVIDPQNPGELDLYRWSPETRQERRQRTHLDEHVWDLA